ncbi:probable global transcription activator SNF2L1 isoform X2 [Topomyia yanbarensis]|uniref:probable global transcription activator SNF2L1 isoform X2 n=1 Tax=Topomyia yanbarensis TaxID=2498891 RepID=UPI00273BDE33|nr:probable global transcription activator SNF2L1 isoform X2 [Topomyia yanbarensis]
MFRQQSTTASDVMALNQTANDSVVEKEYHQDRSTARMRRLEYLEDKFGQFTRFTQQRILDRAKSAAGHRAPLEENNNNVAKPIVQGDKRRKHQDTVEEHQNDSNESYFAKSPSFINGQMRDYQIEGLNWLISMYNNGINGILADEMGLGKTLQAIAMLGYLRHYKKIKGPHLVIVPLSTISNWEREFQHFLPACRVLHGHCYKDEKRDLRAILNAHRRTWDVVVTSYDFFATEMSAFRRINYQYVVIDEAQRCKNENVRLSRELRNLTYRSILFLTGTPINNNLHELWAMLNLLLPEFFPNADDFDSWFRVEDCIDPNHERAVRLKNILQPVLLRRIKADVELGLPPKIKTTLFIPPTRMMRFWSKKVLNRDIKIAQSTGYSYMSMHTLFPYLREVTLHPYLMPGAEPEPYIMGQHLVEASSRMIVLDSLLTKLKNRGSRVLIFSQFVMALNIIDDYLVWKGYKFSRLTGDTKFEERQDLLDDFNAPDSDKFIFMLTTRAGGVGINLPTADTVIFFDIDWNPQQDFQAEDRAHRIGQMKQVHVFRFIILGTVDESLYRYSNRKQALDKALIKKSMGEAEMLAAIRHHSEQLETGNSIDLQSIDRQLEDIFAEVDRGDRNTEDGTLFKEVYLKATLKRRPSEDLELEAIQPPTDPFAHEVNLATTETTGYVFRPRKAKKLRVYESLSDEEEF